MFGSVFSPKDSISNTSDVTGDCLVDLRQVDKMYETPAGISRRYRALILKVKAGDFVSVIGKSGSGKSTLINMLTGIDKPTPCEMYVGDGALTR